MPSLDVGLGGITQYIKDHPNTDVVELMLGMALGVNYLHGIYICSSRLLRR